MLGKRKEKSIRDIATDTITTIEGIVKRIARPRRGTLEREEVERIAAIVVEAIKADMMEWKSVEPEPLSPEYYKLFGTPETGHGRLIIEPDGGGNRFILSAYLPERMDTSSHLFRRGTRVECKAAWDDAVEWMIEKFPEPEPEPEPAILKKPIDPQFDRTFCGTGRIVIESDNNQFRIAAYLPGQAYTFMHGTEAQCYACWGNAVAWMQGKVDARK